ncbi:MAG: hypothetical protein HY820_35105 [Acidobacteria bacterium]|nr:hypothetical protein [Acidobacteriota bacterium]
MPNVAAAAGPRIAPKVELALEHSAIAQVPAVAQAAKETHYTIASEMQAWEKDHDPTHLLRVISMQQHIINSHAHALLAVADEGRAAHNTMRALAAELDSGGGGAAAAGASHPQRRSAEAAVDYMAGRAVHPRPHRHTAAVAPTVVNMMEIQEAMEDHQKLLEQMHKITQHQHDMMQQVIGNLR